MSELQIYEQIVKKIKKEDYKARCEKAIEYIIQMDTQLEVYGDYDILSENKEDLLNILRGEDGNN